MLAIVHSETLRDTRYEFEHGADIVAHAWVDSLIDEGLLKHWKERDFSIIPTLWVHLSVKRTYQPKNYLLSEEQLIQEVGKLHKAGIRILAGSDSPADNLNFTTDFYKELELYNQAGLSPLEVLQTSTINPAKVFKLKDKGVIRVGVSADMVLVNGDILKDLSRIHNIEGVWKKGLRIK
jgi:imidazolonepropionase-like amidohydrolase